MNVNDRKTYQHRQQQQQVRELVVHANMIMSECNTPLTGATFFLWQDLTASFLQNYIFQQFIDSQTYNISNTYVSVSIQHQDSRSLTTNINNTISADTPITTPSETSTMKQALSIQFDTFIHSSTYNVDSDTNSFWTSIIVNAFQSSANQTNYVHLLQQSKDPTLAKVQSVLVSSTPSSSSSTNNHTTIISKQNTIIIISTCIVGGSMLIFILLTTKRIRRMMIARKIKNDKIKLTESFSTEADKSNKSDEDDGDGDDDHHHKKKNRNQEHVIYIETSMMNQDISTLGGDTWDKRSLKKQNKRSNFHKRVQQNQGGDKADDEEEVSKMSMDHCSVDYDFFNALWDDDPQYHPTTNPMSSQYSILTEDSSVPNKQQHVEMIAVVAPAGLLGMVVDTACHGVPTIYSIKESSPLFGQVFIGDKLISINNVDTTDMTALQVSKLIMKLRDQKRVLVVLRSTKCTNSSGGTRCSA